MQKKRSVFRKGKYVGTKFKRMKNLLILVTMLMAFGFANAQCKVYSGSSGWNVGDRVENGKVYSGSSGWSVIARFENGKVYSV